MGEGSVVEGLKNNRRTNLEEGIVNEANEKDHEQTGLQEDDKMVESKLILERTGKETPDRGEWSNPCDFFISCLGYAVGLGNHTILRINFDLKIMFR